MKRTHSLIVLAGLMLAPGAIRAQSGYTIQSLAKEGDTVAGVKLGSFADFQIVGLNDNGEMVFYALDPAQKRVLFDYNGGKFTRIAGEGDTIGGVVLATFQGGGGGPTFNGQTVFLARDPSGEDLLFQYAGGKTTLIAGPGTPVPEGKLGSLGITKPVSINWQGNVLFQAYLTPTTPYPTGIRNPTQPAVFLWNAARQQLTTVAGPGTKLGDFTILSAAGGDQPAINNNNEMVVNVSGSSSKAPYYFQGLLFIGVDGKLQPIAQYGQKLPDGKTTSGGGKPILNEAGVVAFAPGPGGPDAYYLWDKATGSQVGPIVAVGEDAGGGTKVALIERFRLDPLTASGLYQVRINDPLGPIEDHQFFTFENQATTQSASAATARIQAVGFNVSATVTRQGSHLILKWTTVRSDGGKSIGGTIDFDLSDYYPVPSRDDARTPLDRVRSDADKIADLQSKLDELFDHHGSTSDENDLQQQLQQALDQLEKDLGQLIQTGQLTGSASVGPPDLGLLRYFQASDPPMQGHTTRDARARTRPSSRRMSRAQGRRRSLCSSTAGPFFSLATPNLFLGKAPDGREAAYWIGGDRQPKLLLEDGMSTIVGTIQQVWVYPLELGNGGWNELYQVALRASVQDTAGSIHDAILLLTPTPVP